MDQELLVRFKGDTSDLERSFAKAGRLMDMYPESANRATGANKKLTQSNNDLGSTFLNLTKGYIGLSAIMQGGRMFVDASVQVQKYENQLKIASGTQENYAKNTAFLEGLADKYNKNVLELGKSYAQLTLATRGTTLEGEKADRLFAAVTATSSALQMSVDDTNGTFNAFIQMISKGNVQAEELRGQLGERLAGAFNLAAKAMGVTTQELNKMLEDGEVLAEDLLPKLTVELEKSFGESAQTNAKNLGSNIEYAKGQLTLFIAEAGKSSGITGFFTQAAEDAGDLLKQLRLLNKEKGGLAAAGGLAGSFLETLTGGAYTSPALDYARMAQTKQQMAGYSLFPEFKTNSGNFPFVSDKQIDPGQTPAQIEKAKKAADKAAKEAARELNKWTSEQLRIIKDETAQKIAEIDYANTRSQGKYNSWIPAQQYQNTSGIDNTYSMSGGEMSITGKKFSTELGDGATKYKSLTQGLKEMTAAYLSMEAAQRKATQSTQEANAANAEMSLSIESVTNGIENMLRDQYGSMAAAAEKGWGDLIAKVRSGVMSYGEAIKEFEKLNAGIQAGKMMEDAAKQYATGLVEFAGQMGAALSGIGEDSGKVGDRLFTITASLMDQLGQALVVASGIFEAFEVGISSMNPAVALVGAALAFGAASIIRAQAQENASSAFWTGGIVGGRGGVDQVQASLTKGEMIVNGSQQNRLWGIISGAHSSKDIPSMGGSSAMGGEITVFVRGGIKRGDIDFAGKQGERDNNYFRVKRG